MSQITAQMLIGDRYPQRRQWGAIPWGDRFLERFRICWETRFFASPARLKYFVSQVDQLGSEVEALSDEQRQDRLVCLRRQLRRDGFSDELAAQAFALVRYWAEVLLGKRHFSSQLMGGYVMLQGYVAEMDTGEGKTLTATLPAATAALAGQAVHVVTVNDYLASRDAEQMRPLFAALGLSTGLVLETMKPEEKRQEYQADIVYCTNKTLVFDYLRDRLALGDRTQPLRMAFDSLTGRFNKPLMLRGLQFAIVDEADSVFIDEARTPLIISAERRDEAADTYFSEAVKLAKALELGLDFEIVGYSAFLTEQGQRRIAALTENMEGLWRGALRSQEVIRQALSALHGFKRDIHYIVREHEGKEKVMIVDEHTGRVMPDRSWERGLQQLIEIKEGVPISPEKEVLAKISYQMFFRRFLRLSGMTGTCREVAGELAEVYGLGVVRVQPYRPSKRIILPARIFSSSEDRWRAVVSSTAAHCKAGQSVLIGTRSIAASEALSTRLNHAGISHRVLNAKQDKEEAEIVERAGLPGQVTIATNMAGRGTDIRPGPEVLQAGGLHVILTEGHDNARVDRQLIGRGARQGDTGSAQCIFSLEDELPTTAWPWCNHLLRSVPNPLILSAYWGFLARLYYRFSQWLAERAQRRVRQRLFNSDFQMRRALSFAGKME